MKKERLLIFRFSALGDVAMTIPVIKLLLEQHPQLQVTFVSTSFVQPMFAGIDRLDFYAADLKGRHKGITGLYQLFKELKGLHAFTGIADLHNVLRTKILRSFFLLSGMKAAVMDKGRSEKKQLTRKKDKILQPLKSTFQRYADVFESLGYPVKLPQGEIHASSHQPNEVVIGIAPFARHAEKMYPLEKMKEVVGLLVKNERVRIVLFGSKAEAALLEHWENDFANVQCLAGKMSFAEELQQIQNLQLMVSMDSANMHLASLFSVPVVSIWGATHPYAGFNGWQQPTGNAVQVDLYCRPCSVFGNKPCYRGDLACMHAISPEMIYKKIMQVLQPNA